MDAASQLFRSVEGRRVAVDPNLDTWFPVFLTKTTIKGLQTFDIEITTAGNNGVFLGVEVDRNRDKMNTFLTSESMYLCIDGAYTNFMTGKP